MPYKIIEIKFTPSKVLEDGTRIHSSHNVRDVEVFIETFAQAQSILWSYQRQSMENVNLDYTLGYHIDYSECTKPKDKRPHPEHNRMHRRIL